ncbi:MAG: TRAP transporter small permease [Proteobacteria bacterium]|nr:TRAP transporter small permease [Pseudomonadota bacterium]
MDASKSLRSRKVRLIDLAAGIVEKSASGLALTTSLAIIVMMVVGGADVIGSKLFNRSVPATVELTETLMVALVFGGLAYAQVQRRHVRVEFLAMRMPRRIRALMNLFSVLIGSGFFILMTWQCAIYFWFSWTNQETDTGLYRFPIYPAKLIMLIGSALMTIQLMMDIARTLSDLFRPDNRSKSRV